MTAWKKQKEQKHEYPAILVRPLGTDQERIKAKIRKKFSWNPVELRVSTHAYGVGRCTVLNDI